MEKKQKQTSYLSSISSAAEETSNIVDMAKISKGILPNVCDPCLLKFQLGQMKIQQTYESAMMQIKQQLDLAMMKLFIELCACRAKRKMDDCCCSNFCQETCNCCTNEQTSQTTASEQKESSRAWESSRY